MLTYDDDAIKIVFYALKNILFIHLIYKGTHLNIIVIYNLYNSKHVHFFLKCYYLQNDYISAQGLKRKKIICK